MSLLTGLIAFGCDRSYKGLAPTEPTARRLIGPLRIGVLNNIGHRSQLWVIREPCPTTRGSLQNQLLPLINRHEFSADWVADIFAQRPV
jgi:hypothetical protein